MEPHLVTWHPVGKTPQVSIGAGQSRSYPHYSYLAPSARKELCLVTCLGKREFWIEEGTGIASYTAFWEGDQAQKVGVGL